MLDLLCCNVPGKGREIISFSPISQLYLAWSIVLLTDCSFSEESRCYEIIHLKKRKGAFQENFEW